MLEIKQALETAYEKNRMLDSYEKNLKGVIINMFPELRKP